VSSYSCSESKNNSNKQAEKKQQKNKTKTNKQSKIKQKSSQLVKHAKFRRNRRYLYNSTGA
jgi:hypothetical protein